MEGVSIEEQVRGAPNPEEPEAHQNGASNHALVPATGDANADIDPAAYPLMQTRDWTIFVKTFEGKSVKEIAREVGCGIDTVTQITARSDFQHAVRQMECARLRRVERGEYGAIAALKQEVPSAVDRLLRLSRSCPKVNIKLQSLLKVIELAGFRPPTPVVTESPERIIDAMTGDEADVFARTGVFPERFRDQLARLATSVLKQHEAERWRPVVEQVVPPTGQQLAIEEEEDES